MLLQTIDALGGTTTYNYDAMGHQTGMTDALGRVTRMTYDSRGRLVSTTDANNGSSTNTYDNNGNLRSVSDPLGRVTQYQYDARNRLIGTITADGGTTTTKYDLNDNLTGSTDTLGHATQQFYDSRNRLSREIDAIGNQTIYSYDVANQLIAIKDAKGHITRYQYDELGRQISTTDALGNITRTEYDKLGNVTATIDANGNRTEYGYDALNRRIVVQDAIGGITTTSYDKVGNTISLTDSVNNTTFYTYDNLNRLITDTNQFGKSRTNSYDAVGNKLSIIDRDNRKITYTYDSLNRLTTENWLDTSNSIFKIISSTYNVMGELTSIQDDKSAYQYQYDVMGRTIGIDNQGTVGTPRVQLSYQYDRQGNLISVGDKINGITGATTGYTYDQLDRVSQIIQSGNNVQAKRVDFAYNQLGQLTTLDRYSNLAGTNLVINTTHSYDENDRLTNIQHGGNLAFYNYQYDSASRITQISSIDEVVNYNYDPNNQLTDADYLTQTDEIYSYDSNGNRTNYGYQTGTNNQLLSDGTYTYQYDNEGNRTQRTEIATGKVTEYIYDYHNRLTKLVFKDGSGSISNTVEYTYDVNDRRIKKVIDGITTERFIYDRDQISLVFDGSGSQTHRYLYGTEIDQILADETSVGVFWSLTDHQRTVKDLVDNNGTLINHISYDSFGQIVSAINPDIRYGYTGREWDSESRLYYYRARYYDSAVGRFISEDPIGFGGEDSNLSRYVGNSSTNFIDPSGLQSEIYLPGFGSFSSPGDGLADIYTNTSPKDLRACLARQYGIPENWLSVSGTQAIVTDLLRGTTVAGNVLIPKRLLGLPVGMAKSSNTNLLSYAGYKFLGNPKLPFRFMGTTRVFGMLGRVSPVVAAGFLVFDGFSILSCLSDAKKKKPEQCQSK